MDNGEKKPKASPINGQPVPTNPNGRPKGVPNKTTTRFKEALNELFEVAAPQMVEWLAEIPNAKDRFDVLGKFANYIYPQLARTEVNVGGQEDNPIKTETTLAEADRAIMQRLSAKLSRENEK